MKEGKHLILNLYECKMPTMEIIYNLLEEIANAVEMNILSLPYIVKGAPHHPGLTGFATIEQSHISIHTFEENKFIAMDVYSCKDFDEELVTELVTKTLKSKEHEIKIIRR